jgi:hypothetical protein
MIVHLYTSAEREAIKQAADRIKELINDPRNVIVCTQAVLLWNSEKKLREMVEAA